MAVPITDLRFWHIVEELYGEHSLGKSLVRAFALSVASKFDTAYGSKSSTNMLAFRNYGSSGAITSANMVAVGNGGIFSDDGITWYTTNLPHSDNQLSPRWTKVFKSVAFCGTFWLATNNAYYNESDVLGISGLWKSSDGISWTPAIAAETYASYGNVVWNGSYALIQCNAGVKITSDGMTFTDYTTAVPVAGGLCWNGSYWVSGSNTAQNSLTFAKSYDGINWTGYFSSGVDRGIAVIGIAWNGICFVAITNFVDSSDQYIQRSTDGESWDITDWIGTYATGFTGDNFLSIQWNGYAFDLCHYNWAPDDAHQSYISRSVDGVSWTLDVYDAYKVMSALAYSVTYDVLVGWRMADYANTAYEPRYTPPFTDSEVRPDHHAIASTYSPDLLSPYNSEFNLTPVRLDFGQYSGNAFAYIISNYDELNYSTPDSWCTVAPSGYAGDVTLDIFADQNYSLYSRQTVIYIYHGTTLIGQLEIYQDGTV